MEEVSNLLCFKHKIREEALNDSSYDKQVYIDYCHPSQVIKRLRDYGLQSLFCDRRFAEYPVTKPNSFRNKDAPENLLNSANPIPLKDETYYGINDPSHDDNLSSDSKDVNQKGTIPEPA